MEIGPVGWYILPAALILDPILGDPRRLPHPIRWMGTAIAGAEPLFRKQIAPLFWSGAVFAVSLILGTWIAGVLVTATAGAIHPRVGIIVEIILIFFCISAGSLEKEASAVRRQLILGSVSNARERVRMIVGREVDRLTGTGISRATVETVAENLVDGVISPLFYAAIGGAPLALAFKMVNTLDSMIGYKNETYRMFGKAAAKIDDAANFIPARLSVAIIFLAAKMLSSRAGLVLATALHEGANHNSPNAGYPEAAFSGALAIRLGGPNYYHGKEVDKPYIGKRFGEAKPVHIKMACDLMLLSSTLWVVVISGITVVCHYLT